MKPISPTSHAQSQCSRAIELRSRHRGRNRSDAADCEHPVTKRECVSFVQVQNAPSRSSAAEIRQKPPSTYDLQSAPPGDRGAASRSASQNCCFFADGRRNRFHSVVKIVGLAAEDDDVERFTYRFGEDVRRATNRDRHADSDDEPCSLEFSGTARSNEKRYVLSGFK